MEIVIHPLHALPFYNDDDDDEENTPEPVKAFRAAIESSDGVLVASPEYSHSYSGVLKNALDWCSESESLQGKPITAISAAPNQGGGVRGLLTLRNVFYALGANQLVHYDLLVRAAQQKIDAGGKLTDPATREQLAKLLVDFAAHISATRTAVG
jgi:chromate reductase